VLHPVPHTSSQGAALCSTPADYRLHCDAQRNSACATTRSTEMHPHACARASVVFCLSRYHSDCDLHWIAQTAATRFCCTELRALSCFVPHTVVRCVVLCRRTQRCHSTHTHTHTHIHTHTHTHTRARARMFVRYGPTPIHRVILAPGIHQSHPPARDSIPTITLTSYPHPMRAHPHPMLRT
jgi:hypothetical protein